MKKAIFLLFTAALMLTSCAKSDKCKCTVKVGDMTVENQIVTRPDDKSCSEIKIGDIDGEVLDIKLSNLASIDCVNYTE